MKSVSDKIYR